MVSDLLWLWNVSCEVCKGKSPHILWGWGVFNQLRILKNRLKFVAKAVNLSKSLQPFLHAKEGSTLYRLIAQRPETVGAVVWPYQCKSWDAITRLKHIEDHYAVIGEYYPKLDFHVNAALKLVNLGDKYESLHVIIDRPQWFLREGQLVINIFLANVRIYSLAFSFARESGRVVAYVGALQGRDLDGMVETYRDITKSLYGMRPQDFLFELFRAFCRVVGVSRIFAVSEASRHHRSRYFSKAEYLAKSRLNYDNLWLERGGKLDTLDFFALDVEPFMKKLEEIPSRKRSMYRQRYELLETIEGRIQASYDHLWDINFIEYSFTSL